MIGTKERAGIALGLIVAVFPVYAWSKCATSSVDVHGELRSSFKPDYKVLVTLIFTKNQREATAEETALDISDDSFHGRVAFNTLTSYDPLTGHHCHRRPMSVLLRFVTAEGTEWDRKILKFPDDFSYAETQGAYCSPVGCHSSRLV